MPSFGYSILTHIATGTFRYVKKLRHASIFILTNHPMIDCIVPDWPVPGHVKALFTTRTGGVSNNTKGIYESFNLGMHVNDKPDHVATNRALLCRYLPNSPKWLQQVHGADHIWVEQSVDHPCADAALTRQADTVCAIMVADCLPVYLCDTAGTVIGIAHAGWRGLASGVIEQSVTAMQTDPKQLMAWLGPAIGPQHFEVGDEVRTVFVDQDSQAATAFMPAKHPAQQQSTQKWYADIFQLARLRLQQLGINRIYGGGICNYSDPERFFSYRRDGETGRMAALMWMEKSG